MASNDFINECKNYAYMNRYGKLAYFKYIPEEYTRVEYIETNGNQIIDTLLYPTDITKFEADVSMESIGSNVSSFLIGGYYGNQTTSANKYYNHLCVRATTQVIGYGYNGWVYSNLVWNVGERHTISSTLKSGTQTLVVDGITKINNTNSVERPETNITVPLFTYQYQSQRLSQYGWSGKIYYIKLYGNNDELIRHFIPCYRNSDNEVGLYDIINDVFYTNAGTGTFTYGNETTPKIEMGVLTQSNKIQEFTIDSGCYDNGNIIGSVYVKKLNAQLIDALSDTIENREIDASVGVKYDDDSTEYIEMGSYVVEKPKDEQTTNFSSFVAYDLLMQHLEEPYSTELDYDNDTITLADVYEELCNHLELTPVTTTFTNSTITVENNPFNNGETNRTVLQSICKVACAFVDIDYDTNEIDLKWLSNNLDYTFQLNDYSTVEGGKTVYGPVNSLIIKNSVIDSENVSYSDDASITLNGEHQLVISEDYFLYNQAKRTEALTAIWNKVNGLTYTECTLTTYTGKPFLKKGNKIRVYLDENNYIDSYVLQHKFKYDGTFLSIIKCPVLTEQQIQTKQNVSLNEKLRQTEIIVNKQNGKIEEITNQINDVNGAIDEVRTTQTATERRIDIISSNIDENGNVTEVTTTTGFTFNASGLHISGEGFDAQHTSQGTYYRDGNSIVGQYTKDGSKQKDLELFGVYSYGKNDINDTPMFVAQLYTDENGEEGFGHFYSGGDL